MTGSTQPPRAKKSHGRVLPRHPFHLSLLAIALLAAGLFVVGVTLISFKEPALLSSVSASTEFLEVIADGSDQNAILLDKARFSTAAGRDPGTCSKDKQLFIPAKNAHVTMIRSLNGPMTIQISSNLSGQTGELRGEQTTQRYQGTLWIKFDFADKACQASPLIRIPISGGVTLGDDFRAQTDTGDPVYLLQSGHIDIYGRAQDSVLGVPTLSADHALFPTGTIALPTGSRLRECMSPGVNGKRPAGWSGFAEARLETKEVADRALQIALVTDAHRFALTTPGGEKATGRLCDDTGNGLSSREDVVSVSLMTRIIGDPNLSAFGAFVAFVFVLVQILFSITATQSRDE